MKESLKAMDEEEAKIKKEEKQKDKEKNIKINEENKNEINRKKSEEFIDFEVIELPKDSKEDDNEEVNDPDKDDF